MFVIDSPAQANDFKCTDADHVSEWNEVYFTGNILKFKFQQKQSDL